MSAAAQTSSQGGNNSASRQLPQVGEFTRFLDGLTETPVVRLTSLSSSSWLPAREHRSISVRGRFLVFSSDREGGESPYRLDLRNGQVLPLLQTTALDPQSLCLDAGSRILLFIDGGNLKQLTLPNKRVQTVVENVSQFSMGNSVAELGFIRRKQLYCGTEQRLVAENAVWCQLRPGASGCLFLRPASEQGNELWFTALREGSKAVRLAAGPVTEPCWSNDGRSAFFLRNRALFEVNPEGGSERRLGGTSQFVTFSPNADSSVFVGAIESKAQPTVNLLLRSTAREFTLCEHRASHPHMCAPVFSADSRRVYFNSDFQGKPALYSVNVEALIEETAG